MGLIANQIAVEMLYKLTEKIKQACLKEENRTEKKKKDRDGKEQSL